MSAWQKLLSSNLRELRFVFCQNSQRSEGVRNYVHHNYWNLKNSNPNFPIIIRECEESDPIWNRKKALVANNSESEIESVIKNLVEISQKVNKEMQK
ncbi:NADH dehydrogenase, putative [Ichthyophthirius multifiliis]|uniref:NADH dehydrogenase, putative n=1 Tax=Ichthyophthirius multifiliis TaxID=5932 RepID=G0R1D2_ICHMU|nr:NADH dehydrogenase, putative [Ichthyophthirius multifiliis]EGR28717.1 NADH dehydrogenase, putative [Ichthyophthirius multifiliis]|eukprot:XP_004029953.1 NADH dehydrogenase, putative [Ichthyophthirius multifiliis]